MLIAAFGGSGSEDPRTCTFVGMGSGHGVVPIAVVVEAAVAVGNRSWFSKVRR